MAQNPAQATTFMTGTNAEIEIDPEEHKEDLRAKLMNLSLSLKSTPAAGASDFAAAAISRPRTRRAAPGWPLIVLNRPARRSTSRKKSTRVAPPGTRTRTRTIANMSIQTSHAWRWRIGIIHGERRLRPCGCGVEEEPRKNRCKRPRLGGRRHTCG